jgi:hypothetical protein
VVNQIDVPPQWDSADKFPLQPQLEKDAVFQHCSNTEKPKKLITTLPRINET